MPVGGLMRSAWKAVAWAPERPPWVAAAVALGIALGQAPWATQGSEKAHTHPPLRLHLYT